MLGRHASAHHREDWKRERLTRFANKHSLVPRARASSASSSQRNLMVQSTTSLSSGVFRSDGNTRLLFFHEHHPPSRAHCIRAYISSFLLVPRTYPHDANSRRAPSMCLHFLIFIYIAHNTGARAPQTCSIARAAPFYLHSRILRARTCSSIHFLKNRSLHCIRCNELPSLVAYSFRILASCPFFHILCALSIQVYLCLISSTREQGTLGQTVTLFR